VEHKTLKNAYRSATSDATLYLAPREWISWLILSLRFLALTLALALSFFDRSQEGVLVPITHITLAAVAYHVVLVALARRVRWLRQTLNVLVLDTLFTTLAVYLTGGYHSGFFILYFFIVIGAAFYFSLAATALISVTLGLIYVGACFVNPAGIWTANAAFIIAGKVVLLLLVALLCGLLLEQLRREHLETERERALSARLSALNRLFQQLSASLELESTMQTVVDAPCSLMDADVTLCLLRREDGTGLQVAASSGLRMDPPVGELTFDEMSADRLLAIDSPNILGDSPDETTPVRRFMHTKGMNSSAIVGLVLDEEELGLLCAGRRAPQPFSESDLAFLDALAHEAALAIRNARLYERERRQVQELQTLDALQASFVSVVSHELRTPLTCIKTSVDMLESTQGRDLPEVREQLLQTINHHTGRLETLVEDLLDATRLEAGQLTLSLQPTDLRLLVEKTVGSFAPLLEQKKQNIELELPKSLDPVLLDRHRMEQILANLISNANRYAAKGGHIGIALTTDGDHLQLTVSDDGPGIPLDHQKRIFDKFYVVTGGRHPTGVGLGLYIARELVELHGGRIWVESAPGKGSAFHVALPKERPDPSEV